MLGGKQCAFGRVSSSIDGKSTAGGDDATYFMEVCMESNRFEFDWLASCAIRDGNDEDDTRGIWIFKFIAMSEVVKSREVIRRNIQ